MSARDERDYMEDLLLHQLDEMDRAVRIQTSIYRDLAVTSEEAWREQRKLLVAPIGPLAPMLAAEQRYRQAGKDLESAQATIQHLHPQIVKTVLWLAEHGSGS